MSIGGIGGGSNSGSDMFTQMLQQADKKIDLQKKRWENMNKINDTALKSYDQMVDSGVKSIGFKLSAGGQ